MSRGALAYRDGFGRDLYRQRLATGCQEGQGGPRGAGLRESLLWLGWDLLIRFLTWSHLAGIRVAPCVPGPAAHTVGDLGMRDGAAEYPEGSRSR